MAPILACTIHILDWVRIEEFTGVPTGWITAGRLAQQKR